MKLFHLGDLHIGKIVNGFSMIEDQIIVLEQVKNYIKEHKPDALILAGDIYDRSVPPSKAVSLFNRFLSDVLLDLKTPILAVAGNHDGADLIEFGNEIFEKVNLHIEGNFNKDIKRVSLNDEFGEVDFYLVPFADYQVVRDELDDKDIKSLDDAMEKTINRIKETMDMSKRNVLVTHAYVTGSSDVEALETSESEKRLVIGGKEYVRASLLEDFDYVALGHLHRSQRVSSEKIRYSGSLLKYSFSEENYNKSVTVIELDKNKQINIELLPLVPRRDMKTLEGTLEELISASDTLNKDDYIRAILTDDGELIEPMATLRQVYPNIMLLELKQNILSTNDTLLNNLNHKQKSIEELFEDFYRYNTSEEINEDSLDVINNIIKTINKGEN